MCRKNQLSLSYFKDLNIPNKIQVHCLFLEFKKIKHLLLLFERIYSSTTLMTLA